MALMHTQYSCMTNRKTWKGWEPRTEREIWIVQTFGFLDTHISRVSRRQSAEVCFTYILKALDTQCKSPEKILHDFTRSLFPLDWMNWHLKYACPKFIFPLLSIRNSFFKLYLYNSFSVLILINSSWVQLIDKTYISQTPHVYIMKTKLCPNMWYCDVSICFPTWNNKETNIVNTLNTALKRTVL